MTEILQINLRTEMLILVEMKVSPVRRVLYGLTGWEYASCNCQGMSKVILRGVLRNKFLETSRHSFALLSDILLSTV